MSSSRLSLALVLLSIGGLALALWSQHVWGMRPCPWCVFQRLLLILIGSAALISLWARSLPKLRIPSLITTTLLAIGGIASASYHYLVAANDQEACVQSWVEQLMVQSGLEGTLPWLFGIYTSCMDGKVDLWGVDYTLWALTLFVVLLVISVLALRSARSH